MDDMHRYARKYGGTLSLVGHGSGVLELRRSPTNKPPKPTLSLGVKDLHCADCGYLKCACRPRQIAEKLAPKLELPDDTQQENVMYCAACGKDNQLSEEQYKVATKPFYIYTCVPCRLDRKGDLRLRFGKRVQCNIERKSFLFTPSKFNEQMPGISWQELEHHIPRSWRVSKFAMGDPVNVATGNKPLPGWITAIYDPSSRTSRKYDVRTTTGRWLYGIEYHKIDLRS